MNSYIQFPALGIELNIDRVAFYIGSIAVYWYGIIIGAGVLLGAYLATAVASKKQLPKDTITDIVLFGLPVCIICARLYYVVFEWDYYGNHLGDLLNIRNGGLAIYGGIIGGVLSAFVYCRVKRISFAKVADSASFGLLIGQIIGRWGNFFNQEAFGTNTSLPWGMTGNIISNKLEIMRQRGIDVVADMPVHPTFAYESLWNVCVLCIVWLVMKKKHKFDGMEFCTYIALYGLGRFWIEGLRTDSLMLGNVRISQIVALMCIAIAVVTAVLVIKSDKKDKIL